MILNNEEAMKRLNSPLNLINRLKSNSSKSIAMSLFGLRPGNDNIKKVEIKKESFNPFEALKELDKIVIEAATDLPEQPAKLDDILHDSDRKIKLSLAHDLALETLTASVTRMRDTVNDVRPDKLPSVIAATSKVVESIRRERNEASKNDKDREVHFHFYTPQQKKVIDYDVIEVVS